ncbi:hypothetical protein [Marinilactibacillus kalidii]|uniref:hypothetical protein n=1 Tax=Marinilactibacillus kalidii TaxID=2820274 RepID=UPI001ABDDEA6|nr:hypothetical protein [Marinilactibacillus kalidii]
MKSIVSGIMMLSTVLVISACSNKEEAEVVQEKVQEVDTVENKNEPITQRSEENPALHTEVPIVELISSNDDLSILFDYMYQELFWGTEENEIAYSFPDVHSGKVIEGDSVVIDWSAMDPQPTETRLIEVNVDDRSEIVSEKNISESTVLTIEIDEAEMGKQYAVQYLWKEGAVSTGKSMLNVRFE